MKKLISILVAFAMMATLCVCMAFAANPATSTTAGEPVKTPVSKAINKSGSEANPTEKYTLAVTKVTAPTSSNVGDTTQEIGADATIEDVLSKISFDKDGNYEFTVTENVPEAYEEDGVKLTVADNVTTKTYDSTDGKYTYTETTTYSKAQYTVKVIVASNTTVDEEGVAHTSYYPQSVAVVKDLNDEGKTDDYPGKKPDVKPGTAENGFKFTNKFNKKITNNNQTQTDEDKDSTTARISKKVAWADGVTDEQKATVDSKIPAQEFNFKATVTFPANSTETTYTATKKGEGASGTVTFENGKPTVFTLKAGQWLSFDSIETGATIAVEEDSYPGFTAKGEMTATATDAEAGAKVDVTNKYDPTSGSVTGILMSNIPYIVLALVAIGGLCAYVVVRRKNADEA